MTGFQHCPSCAEAARNSAHGGYQMACMTCCARLLAKTRPQSRQAAVMLAVIERAIERWRPAFSLEAVKACAGLLRANLRSRKQGVI